jgi:hypothetical protein
MRMGLAGSEDCQHGTRKDLIAPAPTTHHLIQVGHDIVLSIYKGMHINYSLVCVQVIGQRY